MATDWLAKAAAAKALLEGREGQWDGDEFGLKHPALMAFMTQLHHDGVARELCKVTVFADQGEWRAALHDANTECSLFVTLKRPQDAFQALEKALQADRPDWRHWKTANGKKGKRSP